MIRTAVKGGVKIHEMQPLRALVLPIQRGLQRRSVHSFAACLALMEAHRLTINDINGWEKCETHGLKV
ncbi:hypothetical protein GCM10025785_12770 [Corynebacterium canis]